MTFKNITLALDLSMNSPGFAVLATVLDGRVNNPIVLESSYIISKVGKPHGYRLIDIENEIERLIVTYEPEHYVREKGFSRFATTTQTLFKVVGVSDRVTYALRGRQYEEISPTSIKKEVGGHGKISKEELAEEVFRILQITNRMEYYKVNTKGTRTLIDDKTDALAVGLCYLKQQGLITIEE